jgi:hypothetical protein
MLIIYKNGPLLPKLIVLQNLFYLYIFTYIALKLALAMNLKK